MARRIARRNANLVPGFVQSLVEAQASTCIRQERKDRSILCLASTCRHWVASPRCDHWNVYEGEVATGWCRYRKRRYLKRSRR